jgi:hypothetical protein
MTPTTYPELLAAQFVRIDTGYEVESRRLAAIIWSRTCIRADGHPSVTLDTALNAHP